jgi:polysaccharide biosynthesis/export protein
LTRWLIISEAMKRAVLFAFLITSCFGGCSWFPSAGPSAGEVVEQNRADGEILFDVVEVDDRVVSTLRAQPKESFARRFEEDNRPAEVKIAIGDTISVQIWESAAGGLFTEPPPSLPATGPKPGIEPLAPESQPPSIERREEFGAPPGGRRPGGGNRPGSAPPFETAGAAAVGQAVRIPDQQVESDGAISIPYAGRILAAGRFPAEVQKTIEARLADRALQPQALVIVKKSAVNTVTVLLNETAGGGPGGLGGTAASGVAAAPAATGAAAPGTTAAAPGGGRVPLSPGGDRLLQVIAAAGGAQTPVHETFVKLSRGGVSATIPLQELVSDPAEDIFVKPGDVLTLVRVPKTFSVFGATGRNAEIPFDAETISLSEALGKSQGLRDDLAQPDGVFLFRYEPDAIVRALDQPIATGAAGGVSPIVYRFNLRDGNSFLLAREFPVQDKDVIFVADAPAARIYNFATGLNQVTGPIITGLLVCHYVGC